MQGLTLVCRWIPGVALEVAVDPERKHRVLHSSAPSTLVDFALKAIVVRNITIWSKDKHKPSSFLSDSTSAANFSFKALSRSARASMVSPFVAASPSLEVPRNWPSTRSNNS